MDKKKKFPPSLSRARWRKKIHPVNERARTRKKRASLYYAPSPSGRRLGRLRRLRSPVDGARREEGDGEAAAATLLGCLPCRFSVLVRESGPFFGPDSAMETKQRAGLGAPFL